MRDSVQQQEDRMSEGNVIGSEREKRFGQQRLIECLFLFTLLLMLLYRTSSTVVDPDLWHEMALGREAMRDGRVPWEDRFAYTPTVYPSVHHEWGTGLLAYFIVDRAGAAGISMLNLALIFGTALVSWTCARRGGASVPVVGSFAVVAMFMGDHGFSPIRAQMFSFLFTSILCLMIQLDSKGRRYWIPLWLVLYTLWLNLHAGFLVGAGLFACYWLGCLLCGKPHRHLLLVGIVMIPLVLANPYGFHYVTYLWSAVRLDRPLISEWGPLWRNGGYHHAIAYAVAVVLFARSVVKVGWRHYPTAILVSVTAIYALLHVRMLGFFSIAWLCFVPPHFSQSKFSAAIRRSWSRLPRTWVALWSASVCLLLWVNVLANPIELRVPGQRRIQGERFRSYYPVGPVNHLLENGFEGNLLTPFDFGAYVIWKSDGAIRVSMDSRYEVAYPIGALELNYALFTRGEGVDQAIVASKDTDAILIPSWSPLMSMILSDERTRDAWKSIYQDDDFLLVVRVHNANDIMYLNASDRDIWGILP